MSKKHPVIAVTGSSGAGTTTVKNAFEHIFFREKISPLIIEGDSYHRYDRKSMKKAIEDYTAKGKQISHFGPEANHFDTLAETFKTYGETGRCKRRYYLHSPEEAAEHNARLGSQLGADQGGEIVAAQANSLPGRRSAKIPTCCFMKVCTVVSSTVKSMWPSKPIYWSVWCPS